MFRHQQRIPLMYTNISTTLLKKIIKKYDDSKGFTPKSITMKNFKKFYTSVADMERYLMHNEFAELMLIVCPPKKSVMENQKSIKKFAEALLTQDTNTELLIIDNIRAEPSVKTPAALALLAKEFGSAWPSLQIYFSNRTADQVSSVPQIENDIYFLKSARIDSVTLAHGLNIFDTLLENQDETNELRSLLLKHPKYAIELAYAIYHLHTHRNLQETIIKSLTDYPMKALTIALKPQKTITEIEEENISVLRY